MGAVRPRGCADAGVGLTIVLRTLGRWWRRLFPNHTSRDIDDELRFHLEMRVQEYERAGTPTRQARRRALQRFGSPDAVREACRSVYGLPRGTHTSGGQFMDNLWQDVRNAMRSLARQPSFTLVVVGTLAVGIGASTVIYGAVNSTLLNPIPFEGGDRVISILHTSPAGTMRMAPSSTAIHAWRERASTLEAIATYGSEQVVIRIGDEPQSAPAASVSVQLLPFLGIQPMLGRTFVSSDTIPGQDRVVLLSERFWKQHYSRDPDILGRTLRLNDEPFTIIGILPRRAAAFFDRHPENPLDYALWLPGARKQANVARLKPGATVEQASAEITAIHAQLDLDGADAWPPEIRRPIEYVAEDLRLGLWILLGTVGFVLLLACVNVANMVLIRGVARTHEIGMRTALGASRARLLRQFVAESLTLTVTAAAVAIGLAVVAIRIMQPLLPEGLDALQQIRIDTPVLLVTAGIAAVTAIAFGLIPLIQVRTPNLNALLTPSPRAGATTRSRTRIRTLLVGVEVAMATVLFVGAGLTVKSLMRLNAHDPGFDPANLITFALRLPEARYANRTDVATSFRTLLDQLRRAPNVQHAALGAIGAYGFREAQVHLDNGAEPFPRRGIRTNLVSDDYFRTLGLTLRGGREFTPAEITADATPVVVDENFERIYWPGESAVGRRFRFDRSGEWLTVIGVSRNVELSGLYADPASVQMYQPFPKWGIRSLRVVVRTTGDPSDAIPLLKGSVWRVDPDLPLTDIEVAADLLADYNARPRFNALMLAGFAIIGLALAVVGVYSVVSLALRQRTHELGVRAALGATSADGVRLMLSHGLRPVIGGIVVGLAGALGLSRFLDSLLFEVEPTDPATYGIVLVALTAAAFVASYLPARRATRVDPVAVLRVQ